MTQQYVERPGSILSRVDTEVVSEQARRESRNRETHLPPLSVFRWWARRTAAVNDAVLSAATAALGKTRLNVLDPFAGGGTIPLVALRAGHRIHAQDINPWAAAGISQMLHLPRGEVLRAALEQLREAAEPLLAKAYGTTMEDGAPGQLVHTYRVAVGRCGSCGCEQRQFPYSLITLLHRKERNRPEALLACPAGHITAGRSDQANACAVCARAIDPAALYTPRRLVSCASCGARERLSDRASRDGWRWEVVLVERMDEGGRREFAAPRQSEVAQAENEWEPRVRLGVIPRGSETAVLLRHGYRTWNDLYPVRQQAVIESLLQIIVDTTDDAAVRSALRIALIGTTEFAGHLCRWDRYYLKCNDATAGHRFNFSTFVPEINVWGAEMSGRGTFSRRVRAMAKASEWLSRAEVTVERMTAPGASAARVVCGDSSSIDAADHTFDLVLTDPPYHDDVHYGELSLPFRAWAGLPCEELENEAATNAVTGLNIGHATYAKVLTGIFSECRRVLRSDGRLVFSYANHDPLAWVSLFGALQEAGFHPVACVSVHSENETDFIKRAVDACTEDLLMELAPADDRREVHIGEAPNQFMAAVTQTFARIGELSGDWQDDVLATLRRTRGREESPAIRRGVRSG